MYDLVDAIIAHIPSSATMAERGIRVSRVRLTARPGDDIVARLRLYDIAIVTDSRGTVWAVKRYR